MDLIIFDGPLDTIYKSPHSPYLGMSFLRGSHELSSSESGGSKPHLRLSA